MRLDRSIDKASLPCDVETIRDEMSYIYGPYEFEGVDMWVGKLPDSLAQDDITHTLFIVKHGTTRVLGQIDLTKNRAAYIVTASSVWPKFQGNGYAYKAYLFLLTKMGLTLQADSRQSLGGQHVWAKLASDKRISVYACECEDNYFDRVTYDEENGIFEWMDELYDEQLLGLINDRKQYAKNSGIAKRIQDKNMKKWYEDYRADLEDEYDYLTRQVPWINMYACHARRNKHYLNVPGF